MATDTLVRNYADAFIFTGIVWDLSVNRYLLSELNVAYAITSES